MPMTDRTVNLGVKISADGTAFVNGVKVAQGALKDLGSATKTAGDAASDASSKHESFFAEIFKGVSAVELLRRGLDAVVGTFQEMVGVTQAAQQSHARLQAILRATGDSSGAAARQVEDLVQQLAGTTAFDSTTLRDAAATMATFGRVTGETRSALMHLAADMAATGRGDLQTWVTMLSKVGTAPAEAIGLFERSFGKLDPAIKLAIQDAADFGDQAKAVQIFAQAASSTVGGTAVAAYSGLTRQIQGTKKAWDDLLEATGNKVFDAQSKDASRLEKDLRHLKDFLDEDHWFQKLMISLAGGNPYSAGTSNTPQGQLGMYYQLLQQARASGGPTADLESEIRRLTAKVNAIDETGGGKLNMAYPFGGVGAAGASGAATPSPRNTDGLSALDRQKLHQQQIKDEASYYDEIFKLAKNESDREIALIEYQHKMGVTDEATYTEQLGAQKVFQAQLAENAITKQIAEAHRLEAEQEADLARAQKAFNNGSDTAQPEVLAAAQALAATKAKIRDLTAQEGDAEKNVDEAIKQSGRDVDLVRKAQSDRLLAIQRDSEDYARTLDQQTGDLQAQLDLLNADPLTQEKINNARKLTLDLDTKILSINREIEDLKRNGGSQADIDAKNKEITDITNATNKAIVDQANLITNLYRGQVAKEIGAGLADAVGTAIFQGGKAGEQQLKSFLEQEVSKWILHPIFDPIFSGIAQQLLSGVGLGGSGGAGGGGVSGGGFGNILSGASSIGSFLPSGSIGSAAGGVGFDLASAMELGPEMTIMMTEVASFIPVIGVAIAAIGLIAQAVHAGSHDNWRGQLGFGANANAYVTQGVFGPEGFNFIQGNDAANTQMQSFMASTHPIDQVLANNMTPAQIAAVQANLAGPYNTRNDGQPSTFAFGPGDETAPAQFTLEYLQHKYGTIFDQVDTKFAAFIRGYTGTSQDLLKAIGDYATVEQAMQSVHIKGLDMQTLEAWQQAGETLPQTLQRVVGMFSQFDNAFESDSDKLHDAQTSVHDVFSNLGIAVPTSTEGFYQLVHGIDTSTQAGRDLVTALLTVAPAFLTVANAAQQAVDSFDSIAGQLSPSFATSNSKGALDAAIAKWHTFDTANAGQSMDDSIAAIKALLASGNLEAAKQYALSLGGGNNTDALNALTSVLSAYNAWQGSLSSSSSTVTTSFNNVATAANGATNALASAKAGIGQWLKGLFLDQSLSPLTPEQKLDYAQQQYVDDLMKAKTGDASAMANFTQYANAYLQQAESFYGPSSQYEAIFAAVTSAGGGLIGLSGDKPPTAQDLANGFGAVVTALNKVDTLTGVTKENAEKVIAAIRASAKDTANALKSAIRDGSLTFS